VQPCPNPRRRLIVAKPVHAAIRLDPVAAHHRATNALASVSSMK